MLLASWTRLARAVHVLRHARAFVALCLLFAVSPPSESAHAQGGAHGSNGPPFDVLLILLDDVGIDTMQCYDDVNRAEAGYGPGMDATYTAPDLDRRGYPATPFLDSLAQTGTRFTQFHSQPSCSPTRAAIQSGRYGFRTGIGNVIRVDMGARKEFGSNPMSTGELTVPELFGAGDNYAFGLIGKYHLSLPVFEGGTGLAHPDLMEWTSFRGTLRNLDQAGGPPTAGGFDPGYYNFLWQKDGALTNETGTYATTFEVNATEDFIRRNAHQNWMCVLALHACHSPFGPPTNGNRPYSGLYPPDPDQTTHSGEKAYPVPVNSWDAFRAGLEAIDLALMTLFDRIGPLLQDTLVIVAGDNGTPRPVFNRALFRGEDFNPTYKSVIEAQRLKGSIYRGGARTPLIAWSPRLPQVARVETDLVDAVDLYSTMLDASGPASAGRVPGTLHLDGISAMPKILDGAAPVARTSSYREVFRPNGDPTQAEVWERALILEHSSGRTLELIQFLELNLIVSEELYDLDMDPYEQTPLDLGVEAVAAQDLRDAVTALLASGS